MNFYTAGTWIYPMTKLGWANQPKIRDNIPVEHLFVQPVLKKSFVMPHDSIFT